MMTDTNGCSVLDISVLHPAVNAVFCRYKFCEKHLQLPSLTDTAVNVHPFPQAVQSPALPAGAERAVPDSRALPHVPAHHLIRIPVDAPTAVLLFRGVFGECLGRLMIAVADQGCFVGRRDRLIPASPVDPGQADVRPCASCRENVIGLRHPDHHFQIISCVRFRRA